MSGLSWARLVDAGMTHVEHLVDPHSDHELWVLVASDGSSLVTVGSLYATGVTTWVANVYRPGPRPTGGTSSMREWVHDWSAVYDDASRLLDDVAAIAG